MGLEIFEGNDATAWGEQHEPDALAVYRDVITAGTPGTQVDLAGFVVHPGLDWIGGSPDFLVDKDGMGEIKCPFSQKPYDEVPVYYMAQMQGLMQICERQWCDFVVWTPRLTQVTRVYRSDEYWQELLVRLADFWTWVTAQVEPPREKKVPMTAKVKTDPTVGIHFPE